MRAGFRRGHLNRNQWARSGLDRGRRQGAAWWFIDPKRNMIPYTQLLAAQRKKGDGWTFFRSGKEAKRWLHLLNCQDCGLVRNLARQQPFDLMTLRPDGLKERVARYLADFTYEQRKPVENHGLVEWEAVVEDVKPSGGLREDIYLLKRKWVEVQYGFRIIEV